MPCALSVALSTAASHVQVLYPTIKVSAASVMKPRWWQTRVILGTSTEAGKSMEIPKWALPSEQMCSLGRHSWSVSRLHELARELPVMQVPLRHLYVYYTYEKITLRDMVMHMKAVQEASLEYPIILDEDGELLDGRHRLMKAMLNGEENIKVVRFSKNPAPCRVSE